MVNDLVDLLTDSSDLVDAFLIDVFQKSIYLLVAVNLVNEVSQELNLLFVFEVDTEEKAVEESHWILLDVA